MSFPFAPARSAPSLMEQPLGCAVFLKLLLKGEDTMQSQTQLAISLRINSPDGYRAHRPRENAARRATQRSKRRATANLSMFPMTDPLTKVLLADDHPVVRRGLRAIIENDASLVVCGESSTGTETIEM